MREGGWVFISHSHRDIDAVRIIRNELEKLGFEPLMFYLRCLSEDQEIEELIKREISEREWFIYADSENARASRWVQTEREYIESFNDKHIFTIDLSLNLDEQMRCLAQITRQMKVFLAYSRTDSELAQGLRQRLLKRDVLVLSNDDFVPDASWKKSAKRSIGDASRDGFVIFLMSKRWSMSQNMLYELRSALKAGGRIITVFTDDLEPEGELEYLLRYTARVRFDGPPTDKDLDELVEFVVNNKG